jgi:site-specific DNA-methyltransferase (adenine-specific)
VTAIPVNQIICGDNVETLRTLPDACVDLTVTSPPYDNLRTYGGHTWDFEGVASELWRVTKPGGVVVWVVNDATVDGSETGTSFRQALHFKDIGFRLHDTMIYAKDQCAFPDTVRYYAAFEYMFVFSRDAPKAVNLLTDRINKSAGRDVNGMERRKDGIMAKRPCEGNTIEEKGVRWNWWLVRHQHRGIETNHPATFPEALARDHILSWSNEGDLVLDPFSGSGTTAKMAKLMGRQYLGIEINPEYCEIANERLRQGVLF